MTSVADRIRVFPNVAGGESTLSDEESRLWLDDEGADVSAVAPLCRRYEIDEGAALWLRYGRSALGAALDIAGVGPSEPVAAASYQCGAVLRKLQAKTRVVMTYPLDGRLVPQPDELLDVGRSTRAVLTCVYFGSSWVERRLHELGAALLQLPSRPWVIEDRVMCFPDPEGLRGVEERCDLTVLSFRKHYPVPDGALVVAHSPRAQEALRRAHGRRVSRDAADAAALAARSKVFAKRKRLAWRASGHLIDDPAVNALPESQHSERLVDRVADALEADYLPGSGASAAFLLRADLGGDAGDVGRRSRWLVERLTGESDSSSEIPIKDCRGIGVPLLVHNRAAVQECAAGQGVFLPVHWPWGGTPMVCQTARQWHEQELTLPTPARVFRGEASYLADVMRAMWRDGHG